MPSYRIFRVMQKSLNYKLVAWLLVSVVAIACATDLLHRYQVKRNAASFRQLAEQAENRNELDRAAKYYRLFLKYDPSENDALARLAMIQVKQAKSMQARLSAMLNLEQVLRREPDRHEIRRLLVEQAMHPDLLRYNDAKEHLAVLSRAFPKEAELHLALGRCEEALGKIPAAQTSYVTAIELAPTMVEAYHDLAELQSQRLKKPADAARTLDQLVAANPTKAKAWVYRARHQRVQGHSAIKDDDRRAAFTQAAADLAEADRCAQHKAEAVEILLEATELALVRLQVDQARKFIQRGLETDARDVRFQLLGARLETDTGRPKEALAFLHRGLELQPKNVELLWALAQLKVDAGDWAEAAAIEEKLREAKLPASRLDCLKARVLVRKGEWLEGSRILSDVRLSLKRWPGIALQADLLLAECHAQLFDSLRQEDDLSRALKLDPLCEPAHLGLGDLLLAKGEFIKAYHSYLRVSPRSSKARFRAGQAMILHNLSVAPPKRLWENVENFLAPTPGQAALADFELALLRADLFAAKDEPAKAAEELTAAIAKNPDKVELWCAHALLLQQQEKWPETLALLDEAEKKLGNRIELSLARVRFWVERGGEDAAAALEALVQRAEKCSEKDWLRLTRSIADAWMSLGRKSEAFTHYDRLARKELNNLSVRIALFDLSHPSTRSDDLLSEIRGIEGDQGTIGQLVRACRLLREARAARLKPTDEVRKLLSEVAARKSNWSRLILAEAELEELSGRTDNAIRKYRLAIDAGERDRDMLQRVVCLVKERGRQSEIDGLLQSIQVPVRPRLSFLEKGS